MKWIVFYSILIFFQANSYGQVGFLDSTYVWTEVLFSGFSGEALTRTYTFDTHPITQNGNTYYEILSSYQEGGGNWEGTGILIRYENQKVFEGYNSDESVLMDFSLGINDVFTTRSGNEYKVIAIDSIELENGQKRKRLGMSCEVGGDVFFYWIEGIGSTLGIALNDFTCVTDIGAALLCVFKNDTLLYHSTDYNTCWLIILSSNESQSDNIIISPNPFIDNLTISDPYQQIEFVKILNSLGQKMLTEESLKINTNILSPGNYWIVLQMKNGEQKVKNLIKL